MGAVCGSPHSQEARTQLDDNFGCRTREAMQKLADLCGWVDKAVNGGVSLTHPCLISLHMILKQVEQDCRYKKPITSGSQFTDILVLRKARRYAQFCSAAQLKGKQQIAGYIGSLEPEDITFIREGQGLTGANPSFFVADDPETDDIICCIRGTNTAAEALRDANGARQPFLGGQVHAALLEKAKFVVRGAQDEMLRLLKDQPRKGLAICGHSVGAGVAILATILLCGDGSPFARLMAARKVRCFAFAAPPTFEPVWALPPWVHASTWSFVCNMDCVPRACLGTLGKLFFAVQQVDAMAFSPLQRALFLKGDVNLPQTLPDCGEVPKELRDELGSLFGVGTILALFKDDEGITQVETCTPPMTDRLLIHPAMANDHNMQGYEQAIDAVFHRLRKKGMCC
mmetsp:Transcript_53265/g.105886  ORF Transcript_53265/g.105886 Transcript_53265/m.105886 type:complete len:399 (+) Transcript_53265:63-1259(+)